jgi:hypothetical protein
MVFNFVPYFVLFVVLSIITFIIYQFWSNVILVKNKISQENFKIILAIISTIASVVFGSAVVLQVLNFANQKKMEEIEYYSKLSKEFFDELLLIFLKNPDMNYYYEDLFQIKKIDSETRRNYIKEHMISMLIFSKCAKYAIYIYGTSNQESKQKVQKWLGHIFDTMMKSEILRQYWIDEYKPKLSGPATRQYMAEHYNL